MRFRRKNSFVKKSIREIPETRWNEQFPHLRNIFARHKPIPIGIRKFAYFFYDNIDENEIIFFDSETGCGERNTRRTWRLIEPNQNEIDNLIIQKALSIRSNHKKGQFFKFQSDIYSNNSKENLAERLDAWNSLLDVFQEEYPERYISVTNCKNALSEIADPIKKENEVGISYDRVKALQYILSAQGNDDVNFVEISNIIHFLLGKEQPEKPNNNTIYQMLIGSRDKQFTKQVRVLKLEFLKRKLKSFKSISKKIEDDLKILRKSNPV